MNVSCIVLHDGVPIGSVLFDPPSGVAHAPLEAGPAYDSVRDAARRMTLAIGKTQPWSVLWGDFAEVFARRWDAGRLALANTHGLELGVASVVVLERAGSPVVVADFRPDMARVEAFLRTVHGGGNGRARPAA